MVIRTALALSFVLGCAANNDDASGTAKVRVQVLADESKAIADATRHYGSASPEAAAASQPPAMPEHIAATQMPASLATAPVERETLSPGNRVMTSSAR